jgi:hypothetical protein
MAVGRFAGRVSGFRPVRPPFPLVLGFPWILASESRRFNGLRGIKRAKVFLGAPSVKFEAPERASGVLSLRKARIVNGTSLTQALIALAVGLFKVGRIEGAIR